MPAGLNHRKGAGDDSIPSRKSLSAGVGAGGGASASSIWTGAGPGVGAGGGAPVQAASGLGLGSLKTAAQHAAPNRDTCLPRLQFTSFGLTLNGCGN